MTLALLAACLAASVNTTCLIVLHVCPLPVSNYRLTLSAPSHFIFRTTAMDNRATTIAEDEVDMASPDTTTPVQLPVHNFAQLEARRNLQLQTTPPPFSAHLRNVYNSNEFNLHINDTILLRAMTTPPATPQHTKFYIPLTVENYCFLAAGQDDDTTVNLFYTTAT